MDYNPFRSGWATQETVQEAKMNKCPECGCDPSSPDESCGCDYDNSKTEAMDPVNSKELKGKHKDRKDKDIDNDGDVDSSDEYLHKRRKAVSKAVKKDKEGDVEMNPKMEKESTKESKIRSALKSVLESKDKHMAGAGPTETMKDMRKGKGAEDMMADADKEIDKGPDAHLNEPEIDKKNFEKMTSNVPAKKARKGDNPKGDTKIVPGGTQFKDPAAMKAESVSFAQSIRNMKTAYAEMNKPAVVEEEEEINELSTDLLRRASDKAAAQAGAAGRKGNEVKASQKTDQSRKFARGATQAGDRDAEKAYQASKK